MEKYIYDNSNGLWYTFIYGIDFFVASYYNFICYIGKRLFPICANRWNRDGRFFFFVDQALSPPISRP